MKQLHALLASTAALVATGAAQAHTGHGTHSLMEGLSHPFGLDHLLAMVAVGVWSVSALPARHAWQGPAVFMLALLGSAAVGMSGVSVPYLEHAIALSVVLFGLMLATARSTALPKGLGLGLIAAAASLHGLAHGAETPVTGFVGYAAGFLLTTAVLHSSGVGLGLVIKRWLAARSGAVLGGLGVATSVAGLYLFGQLAA